jgi:hypothetical protein
MDALTEDGLSRGLSRWLDGGQIRAIITRRDRMRKEFARFQGE